MENDFDECSDYVVFYGYVYFLTTFASVGVILNLISLFVFYRHSFKIDIEHNTWIYLNWLGRRRYTDVFNIHHCRPFEMSSPQKQHSPNGLEYVQNVFLLALDIHVWHGECVDNDGYISRQMSFRYIFWI